MYEALLLCARMFTCTTVYERFGEDGGGGGGGFGERETDRQRQTDRQTDVSQMWTRIKNKVPKISAVISVRPAMKPPMASLPTTNTTTTTKRTFIIYPVVTFMNPVTHKTLLVTLMAHLWLLSWVGFYMV